MIRRVLSLTAVLCLLVTAFTPMAMAGGATEGKKVVPKIAVPKANANTKHAAPYKMTDDPAPRVVKILTTDSKIQSNRYVPMAFEIKNTNPYGIGRFVWPTVRSEGGMIAYYANPQNDYNSGIILCVVPDYLEEPLTQLMKQIDVPGLTSSSGTYWQYLQLRHRSILESDVPVALLAYGANDSRIYPDPEANAVFISGAKSGVDAMVAAAAEYDIPTEQVNVAAKIFEVDVADDATLGLDFHAWKNGPGQDMFIIGKSASAVKTNGYGLRPRTNIDSYSLDYPSEFFDFLVVKGEGKVVTEASVMALDRSWSFFGSFETIPYTPVEANAAGERSLGVATEEVGVMMDVRVGIARKSIDLEIFTHLNSFLGFDDTGKPLVNHRDVETKISSNSGQEVVLGGMKRTQEVTTSRKIPILGSIPVLGYIFGGEITSSKITSVVAVVTPTLESDGGVTKEVDEVISQVAGDATLALPQDEYFFDQYLLGN